jgi:threonine synthase
MPPESLRCKECQTVYPLDARYVCEQCFGPLEVAYAACAGSHSDPAELRRRIQAGPHSLWRYGDFLPVHTLPQGHLPAGWTPLLRADRLAERLGLKEVWIKNDAANPTHSFKDRVVSIALALGSYVFIPSNLEEQKVLATGVYGTNVVGVRGTYDDVNRLCTELSGEHEWAFVNINMRPYYAEGSKTLAYETAEQLGWELPDRVVAPIASGSLFTKIARGFQEWIDLGLLEGTLPTFNGAQAAGCSPVASAFAEGKDFCRPVKPDTIAKSLAIGNPADGPYALDLARNSGGTIESVTDDEIREGIRLLAQTTGIFTETAGGVTTAVLAKLAQRGDIDPDERVVAYITGEGLKTLDAVRGTFEVWEIDAKVEAFEAANERVGALA